MKRVRASLAVMGVTLTAVAAMLLLPGWLQGGLPTERISKVSVCQVQMGQVEQLLAATGILRYESEYAAISPANGVVSQVYVSAGEHVKAGQPLFRMDSTVQEEAVSAALAAREQYAGLTESVAASAGLSTLGYAAEQYRSSGLEEAVFSLNSMVVRAPADGLVQQVSISKNSGVLAGTPAVALSGKQQSVRCSMVLRDAEKISAGMRARMVKDGETVAWATVTEIGPAQVNTANGQTVAEIALTPDSNLALPLGANVEVEVILFGQDNVTTLPLAAVTEKETVWWVADGRCFEIPAGVVMADEVNCWVNLPEGTRVVVADEQLIDGQRIKEMKP